jgi:hypothetical protein
MRRGISNMTKTNIIAFILMEDELKRVYARNKILESSNRDLFRDNKKLRDKLEKYERNENK